MFAIPSDDPMARAAAIHTPRIDAIRAAWSRRTQPIGTRRNGFFGNVSPARDNNSLDILRKGKQIRFRRVGGRTTSSNITQNRRFERKRRTSRIRQLCEHYDRLSER
jgi:hypothetical protein